MKLCAGFQLRYPFLIKVKHLFTVESHHATNIIIMEFVIKTRLRKDNFFRFREITVVCITLGKVPSYDKKTITSFVNYPHILKKITTLGPYWRDCVTVFCWHVINMSTTYHVSILELKEHAIYGCTTMAKRVDYFDIQGSLTGNLQCRWSDLKIVHVLCHLTIHIPCRFSDALMSHVELIDSLCRVTIFSDHDDKPYVAYRF